MAIEHINPSSLMQPRGWSQVVVTRGGRTVYVAGQGAYNEAGQLIGEGDYCAQTRQVYSNVNAALAAAGARPDQVVKSTIYVVGCGPEALAGYLRAVRELGEEQVPPTASTLVGVERLAFPGMLIEIDAIAVVEPE